MAQRARREQLLLSQYGDLHLVHRQELWPGTVIPGVPGVWSPRPDGQPGARVDLADAESLLVDGRPTPAQRLTTSLDIHAEQELALDEHISLSVGPEPDGTVWIQVFDAHASRALSFEGIESYPEDPQWRLPATFVPDEGTTSFRRTLDGDREFTMVRPGRLEITVGGRPYSMIVGTFGPHHVLSFRDATSEGDTHGAGRLVWLPGDPSTIDEVDFNTAVLPPCAFNPLVSCPVAPFDNRIRSAVRAGERRARFRHDQAE